MGKRRNFKEKKVVLMEKGIIQFIAKYGSWVSVKKLSVDEKTDPITVMEFLASLGTGIDHKVEENLVRMVDLGKTRMR